MFSLMIALLFKKWIPSVTIVFDFPEIKDRKNLDIVPKSPVDFFLVSQPEEELCRIVKENAAGLNNSFDYRKRRDKKADIVEFDNFNLQEYNNIRLPILPFD